jgi:ribonuclease HII
MFCGIDEAGRGSVMGPLVVAAVCTADDSVLRDIGVRDSKKLTPKMRERMYSEIIGVTEYRVEVISAEEIDLRRAKESLNEIEADMFVSSVAGMKKVRRIYADCPDVNESAFAKELSVRLGGRTVIAKHKADDIYPVVSAASIVAKVTRDRMVHEISGELGKDAGSGYPSDPVTMALIERWIKENGCAPPHTRCSWEPVRKLLALSLNTRITDW